MLKRNHLIITLFTSLLTYFLLTSHTNNFGNPPAGYTSSSAANCGNCHSGGNAIAGVTTIVLLQGGTPVTSIAPSTAYTVNVTLSKTGSATARAGFQLNVLNGAGTSVGTLASFNPEVRVDGQYAEQNGSTNNFVTAVGVGSKTFSFDWTSPATATNNNFTFYASGVYANGNGGTSGDMVSTANLPLTFTPPAAPLSVSLIGKTNATCFNGNNGTAIVSASGGSGCSYTYAWSNGQNGATLTGLSAGNYTVTATCGASTGTLSVNITQPSSVLTANTTGSTLACVGKMDGTASVSASGGGTSYNYAWSNTQVGSTISGLSAGIYTVTVTDNNGCSILKSVMVSNPTNPLSVNAAGSTKTCVAPGQLTATAVNGTAPFQYTWSNNANPSDAQAGNYTVTVTDVNGCTAVSSTTVMENTTPPPSTISGSTDLNCARTSTALAAPSGYTYYWSNNTAGQIINANSAGTYNVTVTNPNNGCKSVGTALVSSSFVSPPSPQITPQNPTLTCSNSFVTLNSGVSSSFRHEWRLNGNIVSTTTQFNAIDAGNYQLSIIDNNNSCISTGNITVNSSITTLSVDVQAGRITCQNPSVTLSASAPGAVNYQWTSGNFSANTQNATTSAAGTYTVRATDANGCTGTKQITVTEDKAKPTVTANVSGSLSCATPSATLSATSNTANATFLWTSNNGFSGSGQSIMTQQAGTYVVTATNPSNGCTNTATATVTASNDKPILSTNSGIITCKDTSSAIGVTVTGNTTGLSYKWSGPNNFTSAVANNTVKIGGDYTVTVTASNGCSTVAIAKVNTDNQPVVVNIKATKSFYCTGDSIQLSSESTNTIQSYAWSNGQTTNAIFAKADGIFSVSVTGANGCKGSNNFTINKGNSPQISITTDSLTCAVAKVRLNATISWPNAVAPIWTGVDGFTSAILQPEVSKKGIYKLCATPQDGCPACTEITVKENKVAPIVTISANNKLSCDSSAIKISAGSNAPNSNIMWQGASLSYVNNTTINAQKTGWYIVTNTGSNGCVSKDSVNVKVKIAAIIDSLKTLVRNTLDDVGNAGQIILAISGNSTGLSYKWSNNATTKDLVNVTRGKYCVTISDADGCSSSKCFEVKQDVGTEDNILAKAIHIYPNPVQDVLNIEIDNALDIRQLMLLNNQGQIISQYETLPSVIEMGILPPGIYFLKIENKEGIWAMKRVIVN